MKTNSKLILVSVITISICSLVAIWVATNRAPPPGNRVKNEAGEPALATTSNNTTNPFSLVDSAEVEGDKITKPSIVNASPHFQSGKTSTESGLVHDHGSSIQSDSFETGRDVTPTEDVAQRERILKDVNQSAKGESWENFIDMTGELQRLSKDNTNLPNSITIALVNNAPYWVFERLVAQGHRFTTDHTLLIAAKNRNDLMNGFRLLGIDIHATAPDGKNAVYAALENFQAPLTFAIAIYSNVASQNTVNGLDTLDYALTNAVDNYNRDTCSFVKILILHGEVELDNNHYDLMRNLEKKNNDMFECIMRSVNHVIAYTY